MALVWNSDANTLNAITECLHESDSYRRRKLPPKQLAKERIQAGQQQEGDDDDEEDDEDDEDLYEYYEEDQGATRWPRKAYHAENYWGHIFDSRRHDYICGSFISQVMYAPELIPF